MSIFRNPPLWWIQLTQYEYWPWWALYIPIVPIWMIDAIRSGNIKYFLTVNPGLPNSGFYGADKKVILDLIPAEYKPKTIRFTIENNELPIGWTFPFIAKPIVGQRGEGVQRIDDAAMWTLYVENSDEQELIIQEYIPYRIELAVFYVRMPGSTEGRITSVTQKEFLHITGDGIHSVIELAQQQPRSAMQLGRLEKQFEGGFWNLIPDKGCIVELEPIGNHSRGTRFVAANYLIDKQLEQVFDNIANSIDGFYYGRYDLRVASLDDLYKGVNIKVLELNGVDADPAHIYDNRHGLFNSIRDLYKHSATIGRIARKIALQPSKEENTEPLFI
jgi:hypothetical protein